MLKLGTVVMIGFLISSCSSSSGSNSLMRMFSGNPERTITVAIKDGTAKQLKNSWDKKALSACGSTYTDEDALLKANDWHQRLGNFLALVDKTLTTGVQFKDLRINIVEIEKES